MDVSHVADAAGQATSAEDETPQATKTLYLDVGDFLEYVRSFDSLSGIQRVVAHLLQDLYRYGAAHPERAIVPVVLDHGAGEVCSLAPPLLQQMIEAFADARSNRERLNRAIDAVHRWRVPVEPASGDILAIPGVFWGYPHYDLVRQLRERGVRFVVLVHDLLQINQPELVHEGATIAFRRSLVDALSVADAVLTNSEFVAGEVREFLRKRTSFTLPVKAVPLATARARPRGDAPLSDRIRDILSEPYVLSVSTIEARKNHMYMIRVWETLIRNNLPNIPLLVFVGKPGWGFEPVQKYLTDTDSLGGRLHVIHGVSDHELSALYDHALFTMFPSLAEGFGLPVGESLAHGTPCIASHRASLPEVGGRFARYVDPNEPRDGAAVVERLLRNPGELARWKQEIARGFHPRSWSDFAHDFLDAVFAVEGRPGPINGLLEPAEIVGMGRKEIERREALGERLTYLAPARVTGWRPAEDWVCWTSSRRATLRFSTPLPPFALVTLYLMLQLPEGTTPESVSVVAEAGGPPTRLTQIEVAPKWVIVDGLTDAQGDVEVALVSEGVFGRPDPRELFVGLRALAYCASGDRPARLTMMERLSVGRY